MGSFQMLIRLSQLETLQPRETVRYIRKRYKINTFDTRVKVARR